MQEVTIDVGGALPYLVDQFLGLIGKDATSRDTQELAERLLRVAAEQAATVQIIGMDRPVSILDIYQPTRLLQRYRGRSEEISFVDVLETNRDAVIFGGPGRGKTVLLNYLFATLMRSPQLLPFLITLRWPGSTDDLVKLVDVLRRRKLKQVSKKSVLLLVDGFDEIKPDQRAKVAHALMDYASLNVGSFIVTCRTFYSVDPIKAHHFELAPFAVEDSFKFVQAFARAYEADLAPVSLLAELSDRGFSDFMQHPLMLAMVCILTSVPAPPLPQTPIRLIRAAIDTLTLRWDNSKAISRHSRLGIDGEDRVRCMMRIAYSMTDYIIDGASVEKVARDHLRLLQRRDVGEREFLQEIAQWYGILIPVADDNWTFVHRTIHDFLAARYWVETGRFNPSAIQKWGTRAAYAACLLPDATASMVYALTNDEDISAFIECLHNRAAFEPGDVADGIVQHFTKFDRVFRWRRKGRTIAVETSQDFFGLATTDLLESMLTVASSTRSPATDLIAAYCLIELRSRGGQLQRLMSRRIRERYRSTTFQAKRQDGVKHLAVNAFTASAG